MKKFKKQYPAENYTYEVDEEHGIVKAITTYAGKTVVAKAKCDAKDVFSEERGKNLAAAYCDLAVAKLRNKRAKKKLEEVSKVFETAMAQLEKSNEYFDDSRDAIIDAQERLLRVVSRM